MKTLSIGLAVLICISFTAIGHADEPDALSKEKLTHQSDVPADETPLEALLRGSKVIETLDPDAILELYHFSNGSDKKWVVACCEYSAGLTKVELAVRNKWGRKASDKLVHDLGEKTDDDVRAAKITVDGDRATLKYKGESDPSLELIRVDGVWKVDLDSSLSQMSDADKDTSADYMTKAAHDAAPLAERVDNGDFKSAQDVIDVLLVTIDGSAKAAKSSK